MTRERERGGRLFESMANWILMLSYFFFLGCEHSSASSCSCFDNFMNCEFLGDLILCYIIELLFPQFGPIHSELVLASPTLDIAGYACCGLVWQCSGQVYTECDNAKCNDAGTPCCDEYGGGTDQKDL